MGGKQSKEETGGKETKERKDGTDSSATRPSSNVEEKRTVGGVLDEERKTRGERHKRHARPTAGTSDAGHSKHPAGAGAAGKEKFGMTAREKKKAAILVAAIDFGTTYSGYAYSFMATKNEVLTNLWPSARVKTPTVVLMNPRKQFHSFGEEAQEKYKNLIREGNSNDWYYFEKFKMQLFVKETTLDRDMEIDDILGRPMKAIDIFAGAIGYIREHLMKALNDETRVGHVPIRGVTDVHWVLTVPAIWNDLSKQFMREAATKAGIPSESLELALEPEAASLFCKRELGVSKIPKGCRYMVVDVGGGTTDITCHEVQDNDTLKEIHAPSGGGFGGMDVDNAFLTILRSIFSAPDVKAFMKNHMDEYWEMMTDFEVKKRKFDGQGRVICKFPARLSSQFKEDVGMDLSGAVQQWPRNGEIRFQQDKIIISENEMKQMFDVAVKQIKETVDKLENEVGNIEYIILVGGFSESLYLQQVMRENFSNLLVLPSEPSSAVLKGAVAYGHEVKAISSRTLRYTYGIARMERFKPGIHPEYKKVPIEDYTFCDDVFNKHIEIGTVVSVDTAEDAKYHTYYPSTHDMTMAVLEVYISNQKNPMFVDEEGCRQVGYIKVDGINPQKDRKYELLIRLIFGGTELIIEIKHGPDNKIIRRSIDFFA